MEGSIEIKAPPERVWEMLALDRLPEWMDEMELESGKYTSKVLTPEDKYRVGATAHITEEHMIWKAAEEYDLEITESLENEKMTVHSKGKYTYTITYILKPVDEGTRLTLAGDFVVPGVILGKALGGLLRSAGEKQGERALKKLKSILER